LSEASAAEYSKSQQQHESEEFVPFRNHLVLLARSDASDRIDLTPLSALRLKWLTPGCTTRP